MYSTYVDSRAMPSRCPCHHILSLFCDFKYPVRRGFSTTYRHTISFLEKTVAFRWMDIKIDSDKRKKKWGEGEGLSFFAPKRISSDHSAIPSMLHSCSKVVPGSRQAHTGTRSHAIRIKKKNRNTRSLGLAPFHRGAQIVHAYIFSLEIHSTQPLLLNAVRYRQFCAELRKRGVLSFTRHI